MDERSRIPVDYKPPDSKPSVSALVLLWVALVGGGGAIELFLWLLLQPVSSGTTGMLVTPGEASAIRIAMGVVGVCLLVGCYLCLRFTSRFCRPPE
jgi:hypothetical protein